MNKFLSRIIIAAAVSTLLIFISCTEENITNPPQQETPDYFPHTEGTYYKFEITQSDSSGIIDTGFRTVSYSGDTTIDRTPYRVQIDSTETNQQMTVTESFFRTTETGVFYFVDTTGFSASLPDSLKSLVEIQQEMRAYLFPLEGGSTWTVYRVSIPINEFISFTPINITGRFEANESILLNLISGDTTITTKKVSFAFAFTPSPEGSIVTYNANVWLADNIGVVKIEGDAILVSLLTGGGLTVTGSPTVVNQKLIEFKIK
ncbi:hypothetical protein BMS3Abin03_02415 [bacterium BMS3Abin03]|nr:hypothetical protein BMS3Abin03_02415 [bacterium BMS3Abin03]